MITVNSREDYLKELSKLLPDNSVVVEIGVYRGDFSSQILDELNPAALFLIDPYSEGESFYDNGLNTAYSIESDLQYILERFEKEVKSGQVLPIKAFSYDVVNGFQDNYFDAVYIDASHLHPDVKRDLNDWLPKLKPDGIMALHDYADIADFGVIQAVDEFIIEHNFEKVIFNTVGGDIALRKAEPEFSLKKFKNAYWNDEINPKDNAPYGYRIKTDDGSVFGSEINAARIKNGVRPI